MSGETPPVLAFDFGGSKTAVALFRGDGSIDASAYLPLAGKEASEVLAEAGAVARTMIATIPNELLCMLRIGAVSPGIILRDRIQLAPNVAGWSGVALAKLVSVEVEGRAVATSNDVKAAAFAERTIGNLVGIDPGLYVNLGTGVAVALVVNGIVLQGRHGAAGEVGYNQTFTGAGHADSARSFEEVCGARSILTRSKLRGCAVDGVAELFALSTRNAAAHAVIDEALSELAIQLSAMRHLLDPQRIVFGGGLVGSASIILPILASKLAVLADPLIEVVGNQSDNFLMPSAFGASAALHGARLVALCSEL
jgi:glucokinase